MGTEACLITKHYILINDLIIACNKEDFIIVLRKKVNLVNVSLFFAMSILLLPKIILIDFFSNRWVDTGISNIVAYLLQDIILVILMFAVFRVFIHNGKKVTFLLLSFFSGLLLVFLLLDMRVRELWLKPIDIALIKYSLLNFTDLLSGMKIFFNSSAGFGYTFRFIVFISFVVYFISWLLIAFCLHRQKEDVIFVTQYKVMFSSLILFLLLVSANIEDVRYHLNVNIMVKPYVSILRQLQYLGRKEEQSALSFEQPVYPFSEIKKIPEINTRNTSGYKNLVIVILESVRWDSVFGVGAAGNAPVLQRLASEGMKFKSYVSVPHSSKGYYAILSGQHAYPDIEVKEAMSLYQPNLIHNLKIKMNIEAVAFSSLNYQFENMGGYLKSIGVSNLYSVSKIMSAKGKRSKKLSSFGASDKYLYSSSIPYLKDIKRKGKGFVSLYFPTAAHYPYNCNSKKPIKKDIEKYYFCIKKADRLIGEMLNDFSNVGLLDSTLFVFVGDHGESFGEHNLFIHNSSMYEEEVTVPLVFWAADKKLTKNTFKESQQIDIAPTIADLFKLLDSDLKTQGKSLLREQGKRAFFMSTFFSGLSSAIVEYPYKYIYEEGAKSVNKFNLQIDPQEVSPVIITGKEFDLVKNRLSAYHLYQKTIFSH